jgi:hypothetical protein
MSCWHFLYGILVDVPSSFYKLGYDESFDWRCANELHAAPEIEVASADGYVEKNKSKSATKGIIALRLHISKRRVEFKDVETRELL